NDLLQVTRIAQQMVVRWGMSPKVGPLNYGDSDGAAFQQRTYSEGTAQLIDEEVRRMSEECLAEAERLLHEHRSQLDALTRALLHCAHQLVPFAVAGQLAEPRKVTSRVEAVDRIHEHEQPSADQIDLHLGDTDLFQSPDHLRPCFAVMALVAVDNVRIVLEQ